MSVISLRQWDLTITVYNVDEFVKVFQNVKDTDYPVVAHVHTIKGKGFAPVVANKEFLHAGPPFDMETGEYSFSKSSPESYENMTGEYFLDAMKKDRL